MFAYKIHYSHCTNLNNNKVSVAVDGFMENGQAAVTVVIKDNDGKFIRIIILVDGSEQGLTSYKAKLSAIYGGYLHLDQLVGKSNCAHLQ